MLTQKMIYVANSAQSRIPTARRKGTGPALSALALLGVALIAAPLGRAQQLTTLYNFCSQDKCADGDSQWAGLVQGTDGSFYGTTRGGGANKHGSVFKVTSSGALTTLYSFCSQSNCTDGDSPETGLVQGTDGSLYGTTIYGGNSSFDCELQPYYGCGTVFKVTPGGMFTTLYSFCSQSNCSDGRFPEAGLVQGPDGNFYGTTFSGGAHIYAGTVFSITPTGTLTTLYSFCSQSSCTDGRGPRSQLVLGSDGNFYGTTSRTVFKMTPAGSLTTLYTFFCSGTGCPNGNSPNGLVQGSDGNFYGTTYAGGANGSYGTVFEITAGGALTTLYSFCSQSRCADGSYPWAGLLQGADGNFYGTTYEGGAKGSDGTIFRITPTGTLTSLYSFCSQGGCIDGAWSRAQLVQGNDGKLYGTTLGHGANYGGTVFSLALMSDPATGAVSPASLAPDLQEVQARSAPQAVARANAPYAELPAAGIALAAGTGESLGQPNDDLVGAGSEAHDGFARSHRPPFGPSRIRSVPGSRSRDPHVAAASDSSVNFTTLYSFCPDQNYCADGEYPNGLVQGADGNFYGTTSYGGLGPQDYYAGTVFKITPTGALTTLYNFCSQSDCADGASSYAGLVEGADGNFYGTTQWGGAGSHCPSLYGCGTVFKIAPGGGFTKLYDFCSQAFCEDGQIPGAGLVRAADGSLYGTTYEGGASHPRAGTIFKITPGGTLSTVYSFCSQSGCTDGGGSFNGLVIGVDGNFYGTTDYFGANGDYGTVFKITPSGTLSTLYSFCSQNGCADGTFANGLIQGTGGNFYGTTFSGGLGTGCTDPFGCGTVFSITPAGALTTLYNFCSQGGSNCTDGDYPSAALARGSDGNFYGTTEDGGANGPYYGEVFRITPGGSLAVLYNFCSHTDSNGGCTDGDLPYAPLIQGADGKLYGTTSDGGAYDSYGTVFSLANPGATLSPTSLNFGNQVINTTSAAKKVTLTSSGTTPLAFSGVSFAGPNASDFAQTNNCPATLSVGAKCTISVTFTPTVLGAESATLDVNDNAANSPQTVALSGTGIAPVTLTPFTLAFGNVAEGTPSTVHSLTLTNNQSVALNSIAISTNNPDYTQTNTCGSTLAAKAHCTISVTLTPSIIGTDNGTLSVADSASNSPQTAALTGTGIVPATLMPPSLAFGNQPQAIPSTAKNLTLTNNANVALNISSITTSNPDYTQSNTCGNSLAAKAHCTIIVTFTPSIIGTDNGTLSVADSAANSPQTASLTGTGIAQATVSPTSLTFAAQKVGTTSAAKNVTLTNNLNTSLTFSGVTFTGANPGDFASPSNTCGGSVSAKGHCTLSVTFTPTATGTRTATMDVNDSANNSPQTLSLTGTGK